MAALEPISPPGRVEMKMHCMKLPDQSLLARGFERQVAEIRIRIAVPNR